MACQVHPALVKWSRVTRFYVNVSRLVHLGIVHLFERTKGFKDRVLSAPRRRVLLETPPPWHATIESSYPFVACKLLRINIRRASQQVVLQQDFLSIFTIFHTSFSAFWRSWTSLSLFLISLRLSVSLLSLSFRSCIALTLCFVSLSLDLPRV